MAPIVFGVLLGALICLGAALMRKRRLAWGTLPFLLLVVAWFVMASIPPSPQKEIHKMFGPEALAKATRVQTFKPTFMDGFLISFQISEADYTRIISSEFDKQPLGGYKFFGRGSRPASWPSYLEALDWFDRRDVDGDVIFSHFDSQTQTAYAAYRYDSW